MGGFGVLVSIRGETKLNGLMILPNQACGGLALARAGPAE
jgi:hypothetical protein